MRSYSRRLLLFGILATTVSAALVVLAIGVVRDPRVPVIAGQRTAVAAEDPAPIETAHSRELTKVLADFSVQPDSKIKLDRPFQWSADRYNGVDYGETYRAHGSLVDPNGEYQAGLSV